MAERSSAFLIEKKTAKMLGFKTLLAWHYLVLFTPLFIGDPEGGFFPFFFERQLTLYLALAVSFGLLALVGNRMLHKNKTMPSPVLLGAACALGAIASAVAVFGVGPADALVRIAVTAALGFSEALLMFLWLRYYAVAAGEFVYRSFAVDMMCGGLIAFLICVLQYPFSCIAAVALPLVAGASLVFNWQSVEPQQQPPTPCRSAMPSDKEVLRHFLKTVLPTVVYGFVFGLLQGGYILNEVALLMAYDPIVLLGILVCGVLIFAIPEDPGGNSDIDTMHRLSLLLFVLGIVSLSFLSTSVHQVVAETAIFAGFNLFDFGAMILALGMSKRLYTRGLLFIEGGRALTYLSLALGILSGEQLMLLANGDPMTLYTISGIAIALLVITTLTPFRETEKLDARLAIASFERSAGPILRTRFCANCPEAAEAGRSDGARAPRQDDAEAESGAAGSAPDAADVAARASGSGSAGEGDAAVQDASGPARVEPRDGAQRDTPWRRTCNEVARIYKLSPRETEIFLLIAKARNAEYVQQKLVISTHTAKTHIANIYHKLGVHSSQEMLSLVEDYKRQGNEGDFADQ